MATYILSLLTAEFSDAWQKVSTGIAKILSTCYTTEIVYLEINHCKFEHLFPHRIRPCLNSVGHYL